MTVDLFCGAGGLSEGFAGALGPDGRKAFRVAYAVDLDRSCVNTYRANVLRELTPEEAQRRSACRSVVGLSADEILRASGDSNVDVVIGGPNCQAVSAAGNRNPNDIRNDMFGEFARLIDELRPRWFVMENVPGLAHRNNLPLLRRMFERLSDSGYHVQGDVLLAADFGVPQYRYRLFIVGNRAALPIAFPVPEANRDRRDITVEDAIGDLTDIATDGDHVPNHLALGLDLANVRRIRHIPPGGDWHDLPIDLLPERSFSTRSSDQKGTYGRLAWGGLAYTVTGLVANVTAGPFTHPLWDRALTAREAARLQGFPDSFVFTGSPESWYRQIGNAVPPPLARAVAQSLLAADRALAGVGRPGRLTLDLVRSAEEGRASLPVLTPRLSTRRARNRDRPPGIAAPARTARALDADAMRRRLQAEAALPGYSWTAKRARALLASAQGRQTGEIARQLGLGESTVRRWIDGYRAIGPEGWRAYHTSLAAIFGNDRTLLRRVQRAVDRVRHVELHMGEEGARRPHMNRYLRSLIKRFGHESVETLIARIRHECGIDVGTVYVSDLLAMADVLLKEPRQASIPETEAI